MVGIKTRVKLGTTVYINAFVAQFFKKNIESEIRKGKHTVRTCQGSNLGDNFVFPHIFAFLVRKTGNDWSAFIQIPNLNLTIFIT